MTSQIQHILLKPRVNDKNQSRYSLTIEEELEAVFCQDSISSNTGESDGIVCLIEDSINVLTYNKKFDSSLAKPVISVLSDHIERLGIQGIISLTEYFVNIVKRGELAQPHAFQLLTQLLTIVNDNELTIGDLETMDIDATHELTMGDNSETEDSKQNAITTQVINTLCASSWHLSAVLPLAIALKSVQLSEQLFRAFVDKCMVTLSRNEEPQEIPVIIKEILTSVTTSKVNCFLSAINLAYNTMETGILGKSTLCDLFESYGLVLQYLSQNKYVCQEVFKHLKLVSSEERSISKIEISTFIAMMGLARYQQTVSDSIYSLIMKGYRDEEKLAQSKLLRMMGEIRGFERFDIVLTDIVKKTNGWDPIVMQGFVKLGISLIFNSSNKLRESTLSTDPLAKTANLGVSLVSEIFKLHPNMRQHILCSSLEQIVTLTYNSGKMPYLTLLRTIVSSSPQLVLDCTDRVVDSLDYVTALPLPIAYALLDAIQPLIKYSIKLRDALLLKMRKALFMKSKTARCIGVYGFLSVLKKFKINIDGMLTLCSQRPISQPFSSSQILVDIRDRPALTPEANEGLCLEVLGILQRSLTQTSDVKQVLYNGFYDVLCVNPQLDTPILEMLLSQLRSYIPRENRIGEVVQPAVFRFDMLFQFSGVEFIPTESLPALVTSIQLCYLKVVSRKSSAEIEGYEEDNIVSQVKACLEMLTQKMSDASLDDFDLSINSDFTGEAMGKKNRFIARTLIGVYEALIEYSFLRDEISSGLSERILLLYLKCERVITLLREKLLPQRRSMVAQRDTDVTSLTFTSLVHILTSLLSDNNPAHEMALTDLRQNVALVRHAFNAAIIRLLELQASGYILDSPWLYQEKTFKKAYQLGRVLLRHIYTPIVHSKSGAWKRDKGRPLEQLVFEALALLFSYIQKHLSQYKLKFLASIRPDSEPQNIDESNIEALAEVAYLHLQGFHAILLGIFTQQQDRFTAKEAPYILQICSVLHSWLPIESPQVGEVYDWMHKVCSEQQIGDHMSSKLLENVFSLHLQIKSSLSIFRKIAEDVHLILGDIDNETEVDDELHYRIVTSRNVTPSVSTLLLSSLEKVLDETDWLITRLSRPTNSIVTNNETAYDLVAQRLLTLVATFHHIIQTSFPLGTVSDSLPKLCTKLYNTFIKAVKYHIYLYNSGVGEVSEKFLKVISYSGTHLEQQMYTFISHYQSLESENGTAVKGKEKEKEKGKDKEGLFLRPTSISKSKIMKQARSYPNLIFAVEQYERFLIHLSKKSKRNLLESFKTSTARDFRINAAAVDAALSEFDELVGDECGSSSDEEGNRSKRARTGGTGEELDESCPIDLSE